MQRAEPRDSVTTDTRSCCRSHDHCHKRDGRSNCDRHHRDTPRLLGSCRVRKQGSQRQQRRQTHWNRLIHGDFMHGQSHPVEAHL